MEKTLYRRPLPEGAIAFSSEEGRLIFREALAAGGLDGYFPLAEQFHTQADPAFCGLGSLVVALNALAIDPGRMWKGPWRWFGEELLDCCVPLAEVRQRGLDLDEVACLARCNGAEVRLERAREDNEARLRSAVADAARGHSVLIASYDRSALGQTGSGHYSPVAGYHAARDLVLLLDVARFKYPPHWVSTERLWRAMQPNDPATSQPRGWLLLRPHSVTVAFTVNCGSGQWRTASNELAAAHAALGADASIGDIARATTPFGRLLETRAARSETHEKAIERVRAAVRALPIYREVAEAVGAEQADPVTMLLLASREPTDALEPELALEVRTLREQIAALSTCDG